MWAALRKGRFGNGLRQWPTYRAWYQSDFRGRTGIRGTDASGVKLAARPNMTRAELVQFIWGRDTSRLNFSEGAPDHLLTIQGEVSRDERGLWLTYSTTPNLKMRAAMVSPWHADGLVARIILQQNLSPASFDDLMDLLDDFPGHVVEFSTYSVPLGWAKQRNTIFWEVRNY